MGTGTTRWTSLVCPS
uniref:Uncharacterized protein n=1 Tax=Arundo donax TaxID=35708 RepID=A0A0A9DUD7_ARUDO